jgi:striatin 1/3/4
MTSSSEGGDRATTESEQRLTAIFRPDDAGEWRERLRLSHEASEQARAASGVDAWGETQRGDEESKEDEESDDDEPPIGEGEGTKIWKAKRTLRK